MLSSTLTTYSSREPLSHSLNDSEYLAYLQANRKVPCRQTLHLHHCMRRDESKEELQLYYKLTDEDMEEITKEWSAEFLVPVEQTELSNPDIIGSPVVTREEYDGPSSTKKKKKKEEVQEINNASEETASDSPGGGGGDEVNQEGRGRRQEGKG
jgi:hypothetical protein